MNTINSIYITLKEIDSIHFDIIGIKKEDGRLRIWLDKDSTPQQTNYFESKIKARGYTIEMTATPTNEGIQYLISK